MSALEDLRALVAHIEANVDRHRKRLQRQIDLEVERGYQFEGQIKPEDMQDQHGRPIILDAQIALLNARAVLAQIEPAQPPVVLRISSTDDPDLIAARVRAALAELPPQ